MEETSNEPADVLMQEKEKVEAELDAPTEQPTVEAQISTNEAVAAVAASADEEKMDELTSLERAIAEMHHVDEPTPPETVSIDASATDGGAGTEADDNLPPELQAIATASRNSTPASRASPHQGNDNKNGGSDAAEGVLESTDAAEPLNHDDLLAVLKGIDHSASAAEETEAEQKRTRASSAAGSVEGVTIEGEGQFQIMDVIDDEGEEEVAAPTTESAAANRNAIAHKSEPPQLTREEVRAIAMEQIGDLRLQNEKRRARKQAIKPLPLEDEEEIESCADLVSQLDADWSDDDASPPSDGPASTLPAVSAASAAVEPRVEASKKAATAVAAPTVEPKRRNTPPKITSVVVLQSGSNKNAKASPPTSSNKTTSAEDAAKDAEPGLVATAVASSSAAQPPPQITGFKRTRIIKRKIIWDPDAPETNFSYAQLVRSSTGKSAAAPKPEPTHTAPKSFAAPAPVAVASGVPAAAAVAGNKKEPPAKKVRPMTPKSVAAVEKKAPRAATPSKTAATVVNKAATAAANKAATASANKAANASANKAATATANKAATAVNKASTNTTSQASKLADETVTAAAVRVASPVKRRSQTPVANGAGTSGAGGKKKKITELDRLMGDEGAVNMLNSLEFEHGKIAVEAVADDKPHKPLMRSRAATISERIIKRAITPTPEVAAAVIKKDTVAAPVTAKNKRGGATKPKASSSWDYVYKQQASDDSMIIRRRSNSSYSSNASAHRSSLDGPGAPTTKTSAKSASASSTPATATNSANNTSTSKSSSKASPKTPKHDSSSLGDQSLKSSGGSGTRDNTPTTSKTFEFAKPDSKSNQKTNRRTKSPSAAAQNQLTSDMKKASNTTTPGRRTTARSPATVDEKSGGTTTAGAGGKEPKVETAAVAVSPSTVSDVVVKKTGKVAQVVFNTHRAKLEYSFTAQMMNKLVDILDQLSADVNCHAVVMLTNAPHFCQGIDFTDLTVGSAEKRKNSAVNLANAVKNYLKTLATFPKPLIAGVNGRNIGLGVTQLPLFDIVVASDKGTYETPYAKFGQVPEGYCIWNNITKIRGTFKTKLFWLCEKLNSTESALSGLVNKITVSDKVNEDAFAAAKKIAAMSAESYRVMKKTTIHNHLDAIITALDEEFGTITAQWTSAECQENFKKYLETGQL